MHRVKHGIKLAEHIRTENEALAFLVGKVGHCIKEATYATVLRTE